MSVMGKDGGVRPGGSMGRVEVRNEFAAVAVEVDSDGNDPRLKVTDLETGRSIFLDASLLRSLVEIPDSLIDEINRASIQQEAAVPVQALMRKVARNDR
jgi:hypothetical protein